MTSSLWQNTHQRREIIANVALENGAFFAF
jgi:hypothetical protein